jgi:hypothetical protein
VTETRPVPAGNVHPYLSLRATAAVLLLLAAVAASAQERPIESGLGEEASARLVVAHVRIQPTRWANLGECRGLVPGDLSVSLRGKRVDPARVDIDHRWRPTLHALALDTSASMAGDLPYAQHAASEYVKQLRPGHEKALIVTFDESVALQQPATSDTGRLIDVIAGVRIGARTAMLDAMYYSMRELDAHRERPVLLLLTDGADKSSLYGAEDLMALIESRPDLTLFTIGVGLRTDQGEKATRQLLKRLADAADGEFFDAAEGQSLRKVFSRIRDVLENERIVTVSDPKPGAKAGKLQVRSRNPNCTIRMLRDKEKEVVDDPTREPIPRPFPEPPQSYSSRLTVGHRGLFSKARERSVDPGCGSGGYFHRLYRGEPLEPLWFFHVGQREISGCGLDVTMEHGLLYSPEADGMAEASPGLKLRARPFELSVPEMEKLPRAPEQVMDALARTALALEGERVDTDPSKSPPEHHARPFYDYPNLAHGLTFMEMRPVLARAAFLYPRYREWALDKLRRAARDELAILIEGYRRSFPEYPDATLQAVVRQSEEGQRILFRAENPSETDLVQYLAAWLGDISAHEAFRKWEKRRILGLLDDVEPRPSDERFVEAWGELRRVFFVPSYARSLTVLQPAYDAGCDCVGYWRLVLPRTSWMKPRIQDTELARAFADESLDLIPDVPLGFWVVRHVASKEPRILDRLRDGGYEVRRVAYQVLGVGDSLRPGRAFGSTRVNVVFGTDVGQEFVLGADLALEHDDAVAGNVKLVELGMRAVNDAELEELAGRAREALMIPAGDEVAVTRTPDDAD